MKALAARPAGRHRFSHARGDMTLPADAQRSRAATFLDAVTVYFRPRVLVVLLLGFSSGLPLALTGETLTVWMADSGVDLGTIGVFALVGLPYTVKFLWAPIVDALQVPWLTRRLGRRRGWLVATQLLLMAAILFLGTRDPAVAPLTVALGALIVAFASATQDIVIDAYRVESLPTDEQAAGMASYVAAYRVGQLVSVAGLIGFAAWLEGHGLGKATVWPIAYAVAAGLVMVGLIAVLIGREPEEGAVRSEQEKRSDAVTRVLRTAWGAFADFLTRDAAVAVLVFVVLYKLCDALAGRMTAPFVLALGYDKEAYATIVKGVGFAASIGGGLVGGAIARTMPLAGALWLGAVLQMASNLVFVWLNFQPVGNWALSAAILVENCTAGVGTVVFVAYLSALCGNPLHTATQFALLTALASTGRTVLSTGTGYAVQAIGWPLFFIATAATALPALALMAWLQRRGHFASLEAERNGA
jgi:MFS transporter, PAT family, beta-lactamase induction signal transducer AmpG